MLKLEVNHLKEKEKFKQEIQEHLKYDGKFIIKLIVLKILLTSSYFFRYRSKAESTENSEKSKK